jgi:hypothetical protein
MLRFIRDLFSTRSPQTVQSLHSTPLQTKDEELQDNVAVPFFTKVVHSQSAEIMKPIAKIAQKGGLPDKQIVDAFKEIFGRIDPLVLNSPDFERSYFTESFIVEKTKISSDLWGETVKSQKQINLFIHNFLLANSTQLRANVALKKTKETNVFKAYVLSVPKDESDNDLDINPTSLELLSTASIRGLAPKFYRIIDPISSSSSTVYKASFITRFAFHGSLKQYLRVNQSIEFYALTEIGRQILEKISFLHSLKIAHRDIKPHNMVIDSDLNVFLIDFGYATQESATKQRCGSLGFTPPEYDQNFFCGFNYKFKKIKFITHSATYDPFLIDCYTTGLVLFHLLNREGYENCIKEYISFNAINVEEQLQLVKSKDSLMQFKQEISDKLIDEAIGEFPKNFVDAIKSLIKINPAHRATIDEALALWTDEKLLKAPTSSPLFEEEMVEL